jgi:hypothetical protein
MALKSGFRLEANLLLDVRVSNVPDLPMAGYSLELFYEGALAGATMMMRRPSSTEFQQVLSPISG